MSNQKFFTLLYGGTVHAAPKGKVIPAAEISQFVTGTEIVQKAKEESIRYRTEIATECELLKEQAQREGFKAGYEKWLEHLAELEAEIESVQKAMEKTIIPVALKAARKILGREIELSETAIVDIVSMKLKAVAQHKRVTIYVNKDDLARLEKKREQLKQLFESIEVLSLRSREDISRGGCVIETEAGIINAQIENQWELIENAFQGLAKQASSQPKEPVSDEHR